MTRRFPIVNLKSSIPNHQLPILHLPVGGDLVEVDAFGEIEGEGGFVVLKGVLLYLLAQEIEQTKSTTARALRHLNGKQPIGGVGV